LFDLNRIIKIMGFTSHSGAHNFVNRDLGVKPIATRENLRKGRPANLYRVGDIETALLKLRGELQVIRTPMEECRCSPSLFA